MARSIGDVVDKFIERRLILGNCRQTRPRTIQRLTLSPSKVVAYLRTARANLNRQTGNLLMPRLSLRLAIVFSIAPSSLALAVPAGAQLAGGPLAFDARPGLEFVQFGDSWGDRRSSYRNDFFDPFWGERRSPRPSHQYHPYHSNDSYNPSYRRAQPQQQVYESIKPPAPRKMETAPAQTVLVIGDSLGEWLAYGLELVFAETPQIGIVGKIKPDLGLVRDDARLAHLNGRKPSRTCCQRPRNPMPSL